MMGRSRYLPDQALLDHLFRAAGVVPSGDPPGGRTEPLRGSTPPSGEAPSRSPAGVDRRTTPPSAAPAPAVPHAPDPRLSGQTLAARYDELAEWMVSLTGASVSFVADSEGLPLTRTRAEDETYVAVAALLAGVRRDLRVWLPSQSDSTIAIDLGDVGLLTLVWAETAIGSLAAGVVLDTPLAKDSVAMIRDLLIQAAMQKG